VAFDDITGRLALAFLAKPDRGLVSDLTQSDAESVSKREDLLFSPATPAAPRRATGLG